MSKGADSQNAKESARDRRWLAAGRAKVTHPSYGSVVVPHLSKLAAIENAAEFWRVDWLDIVKDCAVMLALPEDGKVRRPKEYYTERIRNRQTEKEAAYGN